MKHPVLDRVLILFCALLALLCAVSSVLFLTGQLTFEQVAGFFGGMDQHSLRQKIILVLLAVLFAALAVLLVIAVLPGKKKRSSNFAIQHNENGMVRISVKALETLVEKVLEEHSELKVVTSSIFSDEESVRVDLHICLQSDISMPLAISALQKQIKKYLESCSGVMVQEVRVYVDNTTPPTNENHNSPYVIPASFLAVDQDTLPKGENLKTDETLPPEDTLTEDTATEEWAGFETDGKLFSEYESTIRPTDDVVIPGNETPLSPETENVIASAEAEILPETDTSEDSEDVIPSDEAEILPETDTKEDSEGEATPEIQDEVEEDSAETQPVYDDEPLPEVAEEETTGGDDGLGENPEQLS